MNYKESKIILEEIKKAKRILVNCHRGPDPDSVGSSLALYGVLEKLGKRVEIVCPSNEIPENTAFLKNFKKVQKNVNFSRFDFSKFDLFITLDSSSWEMVTDLKDFMPPNIPVVVIDHHKTNTRYGRINLVDDKVTSTGELIYLVIEDWGLDINKDIATALMTGIVGDTGAFRFPGSTRKTFEVAGTLMSEGADKDKIIFHIYHSISFDVIKFWGEAINKVKVDSEHRFVWSAVPYEKFVELGGEKISRESSASLFAQIVDGTDFGFVMVEQEKNALSVSFRSRTGVDTSSIAAELGGGGHIYASGAKVEGLPFDKAVEKVLQVARKYSRKV